MLRLLLAAAVAGTLLAPAAAAEPASHPEIRAVYPNPVAPDDDGEFVVLAVPPETDLTAYALSDGEARVALPAAGPGTVRLSTHPNLTRQLVDGPVARLSDRLRLANEGERLRLERGGETVDAVGYEDAPEGDLLRPASDRRWRPLGATDRPVVTATGGTVEAFVLPDAGGLPARAVASAERRVRLAGYTLTSAAVADALVRARRRGADVRVLVDGDPVGGFAAREVAVLDRLVRDGIDVRALGGPRARYRFHHAKYAVIDGRALVTTENWKPAGTGGNASRGWGAVTTQSRIVEGLAATFRADAGWRDAIPWSAHRAGVNATATAAANGSFRRRFAPARLRVDRTRLLVAPDNAERAVLELLGGAEESVWIEQAGVGGPGQPFVAETVDAARRGVAVRLLLGSAWYNRAENRAVAERLRAVADREDLDLAVRLVEPGGRFARLHAKGAVIDGERVLLGSLNWNNNSARHNREVALVLEGDAVAAYYGRVVRADWRGARWRLSVGVLVACLVLALLAVRRGSRIDFEA